MDDSIDILDVPLEFDDCDAKSFREYFKTLLFVLWEEGAGFSGKRPFGNSGWQSGCYANLIRLGLVKGSLDEDGYIDSCDDQAAYKIILDMIKRM